MPIIHVECGTMTREQKDELVKGLTKVASDITKINSRFFIVVINETSFENIGYGGEMMADIMARREKK